MFILQSGYINPDYYAGGSHMAYGEKQPNVSSMLEQAKKYRTEQAADNAMKRINEYTSDYVFYVVEYNDY